MEGNIHLEDVVFTYPSRPGVQVSYWARGTGQLLGQGYRSVTGLGVQVSYRARGTGQLLGQGYRSVSGPGVQVSYWARGRVQ